MCKINWSGSIVVFLLLLLAGSGVGLAQPYYQNIAVLGLDGTQPLSGLTRAADGFFYGTTSRGGDADKGTLFRIGPDGDLFETLYHFTGAPFDGDSPQYGALAQDSSGMYYGTTFAGGSNDAGTLFKLDPTAQIPEVHVLFSFPASTAHPSGGVILGRDGISLYGTTGEVSSNGTITSHGSVFGIANDGTGFNILHAFAGPDGSGPLAGVIEASDGLLYGTTEKGGANGEGTLYRIAKDGTAFQTLYHFPASGAAPVAGLIEGADGRLYGVAPNGGAAANSPSGYMFAINRDGSGMKTLHSFSNEDAAGGAPTGALTQNNRGSLFGTTRSSSGCPANNCGSIFAYQPDGTFTTLHTFEDPLLGASPVAQLTLDGRGNLYGTTSAGGDFDGGTAFLLALPQLDLQGPAQVSAGGTATYSLSLSNTSAFPLPSQQTLSLKVAPTALPLNSESTDAWACNSAVPDSFNCNWISDLAPATATDTHTWTFDIGNGPYADNCDIRPAPCIIVSASDPESGQTAQFFTQVASKRPDGTIDHFPQAVDDEATLYLPDNASVVVHVLSNDSDPDGDDLTVSEIVSQPAAGTVVIENDGSVIYTATNAIDGGTDQFRYRVADGYGASTTALVTIHFTKLDAAVSTSKLDIGNVPTGRLASKPFWVDVTTDNPPNYSADTKVVNMSPAEIDAALAGTGYDRNQTVSDATAFGASYCQTGTGETNCSQSVFFLPTAPAGKVSIARLEVTFTDLSNLRPFAKQSIIVIGRSALEAESPVVARDDTFTVFANTQTLIDPGANDETKGLALRFGGIGLCDFAYHSLGYAPCTSTSDTINTPVLGSTQVGITPAPGFNGTNSFLYAVAQNECVNTGCLYENTIYYEVVTVNVVPTAADVSVSLATDQARVEVGAPVTITAKVTNNGPSSANDVRLSGFLSLIGLNPTVTTSMGSCAAPATGRPVECSLGSLDAGTTATISLIVVPDGTVFTDDNTEAIITDSVTVSAQESDTAPENNQATVQFAVTKALPPPRITASFIPESTWDVNDGENFGFYVAISNASNGGPTTGPVTFSVSLPSGMTFIAGNSSVECNAVAQQVTCSSAAGLPANREDRFRIGTGISVGGAGSPVALTLRMTDIQTPDDQPIPATDQVVTVFRDLPPRLSVSFKPNPNWEVNDGENFGFYVAISNAIDAGSTTQPVTLSLLLPDGMTFIASDTSADCNAIGQGVTCIGAVGLPPNREALFRIGTSVSVGGFGDPVELNLSMQAIQTPEDNPVPPSNQVITVIRPTAPRILASFQPDIVWETQNGNNFGFFVVLTNAEGAGPVQDAITFTNLLPEGLTFVPSTSSPECSAVGQLVTCTAVPGLPGGRNYSFRIGTTVNVSGSSLPASLVNRLTSFSVSYASAAEANVTITVKPNTGATPAGQNVTVQPTDSTGEAQPIIVTFNGITSAGETTATPILAGIPAPAGFEIDGQLYDIKTTASYTAPVTVCFDGNFTASSVIQHGETDLAGRFVGWTILPNQRLLPAGFGPYTRICADSNSLSPFAVMKRLDSDAASTITLRANRDLAKYGQNLVLYANVEGQSPVGIVTFIDGEKPIGYVRLHGGHAVLKVNDLDAGSHHLVANYSGDAHNEMSMSDSLSLVVDQSDSETRLHASDHSVKVGRAINLTADIHAKNPTGNVDFLDSGVLLGTGTVSQNDASLNGVILTPGTHKITAIYNGDLNYKSSASQVLTIQVRYPKDSVENEGSRRMASPHP